MDEQNFTGPTDADYAAPEKPINYQPFRLNYRLPDWKDTKGRHQPFRPVDFGTDRFTQKDVYWSRENAEVEWERIFARTWHMVGHINDIPTPNSFMKVDIGHESILVVRGENDELHAFYNVCQHRGTKLVTQDFGKTKKLVCPFHRWEFTNKGDLLAITDRETFRTEALCHDLNIPKVKVSSYRGWLFINMDLESQSLEDFLTTDFMDMMESYDFERAIRVKDIVQEWPVNWKTAHEAFNEGYHVQATHPQLAPANDAYHAQHNIYDNGHALSVYQFMTPGPHVADKVDGTLAPEHKIFLREAGVAEADFPKDASEVPHMIIKAKYAKKDYAIDYSKFSESQLIDSWGIGFFPSTETFMQAEGFFNQHWRPHPSGDPEKCIYTAQVYAIKGIGELPSYMGVENADLSGTKVLGRTYLEDNDFESTGPVISQDRELVPRLQEGMKSKGFNGGVFCDQEIRLRQFYHEYFQYLDGTK